MLLFSVPFGLHAFLDCDSIFVHLHKGPVCEQIAIAVKTLTIPSTNPGTLVENS